MDQTVSCFVLADLTGEFDRVAFCEYKLFKHFTPVVRNHDYSKFIASRKAGANMDKA